MSTGGAPVPPIMTAPATGQQNVVYHVYQMSSAKEQGIQIPGTKQLKPKQWFRPILLFLQWAMWVVYLAGAALVSLDRGPMMRSSLCAVDFVSNARSMQCRPSHTRSLDCVPPR